MTTDPPNKPPARAGNTLLILCGTVVLTIGTVVIGVVWLGERAATSTIDAIGGLVRPRITHNEIVTLISTHRDTSPKLVVLTQHVDVILEASDQYEWLYVNWGTNRVRLEFRGNRVQWVLPLSSLGEQDVTIDEESGKVTVLIPPPQLDAEMVVVQADQNLIREETSTGWARLGSSTRQLAQEQKQEIVKRIIEEADTPDARAHAAGSATEAYRDLLETALGNHPSASEVTLDIRIRTPDQTPEIDP